MIGTYFLVLFGCFLGIVLGAISALISPEEMSSGKKYFNLAEKIIVLAILIVMLVSSEINLFVILFFSLYIILTLLSMLLKIRNLREYVYMAMPLAILAYINNTNLLIIESSLIFILGFPFAMLYIAQYEKSQQFTQNRILLFGKTLLKFSPFLIFGAVIYALNYLYINIGAAL